MKRRKSRATSPALVRWPFPVVFFSGELRKAELCALNGQMAHLRGILCHFANLGIERIEAMQVQPCS